MGQNKVTRDSNAHDEERNTTDLRGDKNARKTAMPGENRRKLDPRLSEGNRRVALPRGPSCSAKRVALSGLTSFPGASSENFASCIWDVNT